ncbi:DNA cross-link repair protein PSO2/SNM1 [Coemansia spiralis]|nr:DNA cross-link repair protein PSO2/SNM1 [Coemansia spiralis]
MTKRGPSALDSAAAACPVCQAGLADMSPETAELHVNGCLDVALLEDRKRARRTKTRAPSPCKLEPKALAARPVKEEPAHRAGPRLSAKEMLCEIEQTASEIKPTPDAGPRDILEKAAATVQRSNRPMPDYKRMPHTSFTVDAFQYGRLEFCTGYFLTHFHSDHYGGLTRAFSGELYCSRITANCVRDRLGINPNRIHELPTNTRCLVQGVNVTLIDANHCPGAAILLFEVPLDGRLVRIVHTGDFRATRAQIAQILCVFGTSIDQPVTPAMLAAAAEGAPDVSGRLSPLVDFIYLDTTYLDPGYSFPKQSAVVDAVAELCTRAHNDPEFLPALLQRRGKPSSTSAPGHSGKQAAVSLITRWFRSAQAAAGATKQRVLFVVGSYTIGKERLFVEIALRLGARIYVTPEKYRMLQAVGSPSLLAMLTTDMACAQVHAVPMGQITMQRLAEYLDTVRKAGAPFTSIVAFKPTGWSHAGHAYATRPPPEYPQPLDQAAADRAWADGGAAGLAAALARAARMDGWDGASGDQWPGPAGLRPHGMSAKVAIFPVPYSEHSSFAELAAFVCSLKAARVIATVPAAGAQGQLADTWLQHWQDLNAEYERRVRAADSPFPEGLHPVLGMAATSPISDAVFKIH